MKKLLLILSLFLSAASFAQTAGEIANILAAAEADVLVTGQGSQTAVGNNILLASAGTGSVNLTTIGVVTYRSFSVTIVPASGTVTAGVITFEGSNDNFVSAAQILLLDDPTVQNLNPISNYTIVASTPRTFVGNTPFRFVRARISTGITGTTTGVQAFVKYSPTIFRALSQTVTQLTPANFSANIGLINGVAPLMGVGASGTGSLRTKEATEGVNLSVNNPAIDVASAAITTTTTTAAFTPTSGISYTIVLNATVVTGTSPTNDTNIEESPDGGTTWFHVYSLRRLTAVGTVLSVKLPNRGNRVRYVQTISGTTPSFTRSITRLQTNDPVPVFAQLIDRTLAVNTLNSTTASVLVDGASNVSVTLQLGAATTPPVIQIEGSDNNSSWYSIGNTLNGVASSSVSYTINGVAPAFIRARVSTAGVSSTLDNILIKAF